MKNIKSILLIFILLSSISIYSQNKNKNSKMATKNDSISYVLGLEVGNYYQSQDILINTEHFMNGLVDAINNKSTMDQATKDKIIQTFQQEQQAKTQDKNKSKSAEQKRKGKEFLEVNKKIQGVIETKSGLQYKIVKEGQGENPKATDNVKVHYHGTLLDGTVFDSSKDRNQPATFPLNRVIPGWTEGVQLMKPGSIYIFYIPSDLAYGDNGAGNQILPGATLIFEVELLEINPKQ